MGSCQTTRGADVNAQDDQRDSALPLAGASGFTEIAHATLAAGADLQKTGEAIGSTDQQAKGLAKQVEGKLQKAYGDVKAALRKSRHS